MSLLLTVALAVGGIGVAPPPCSAAPGALPPRDPVPISACYTVTEGDTLTVIAQKFINHYRYPFIVDEWIAVNPQLDDPDVLAPGMQLIVPNLHRIRRVQHLLKQPRSPWNNAVIRINLQSRQLTIHNKNTGRSRSFPIGIGHPQTPSPAGSFVIYEKLDQPIFRRSNGTVVRVSRLKDGETLPMSWVPMRALGLRFGSIIRYRIHSTTDPNTVGENRSNGCIRMHIDDALELYQLVTIGTEGRISR